MFGWELWKIKLRAGEFSNLRSSVGAVGVTWGSSVLSEHGQIKKKEGYDWDQELDVECKITKTARHPKGTRLRIRTAPSASCLV